MEKWLDKLENGGQFEGLTNEGFNYNGAWGGPAQSGKKLTVASKDDPRYKAYQDSLSLYKNYQDVTKALNKQEYTSKPGGSFETALSNAKARNKKIKNNDPEIRKEVNSLSSIIDFIPGQINRTLPRQLFSETIKPKGMKSYRAPSYFFSEDPIPGRPHDARSVADYSNVKPRQEVVVGKPTKKSEVKKVANSTNSGYTLQHDGTKYYQSYIPKGMMTKEVVSSTGDRSVEFVPQPVAKRKKEQSISTITPRGIQTSQGITPTEMNLRPMAKPAPDYYDVQENINAYGGGQSNYRVDNPNDLREMGPGNTQTVTPHYPGGFNYQNGGWFDQYPKSQNGSSNPGDNVVNNIQYGLDALQEAAKYIGKKGALNRLPIGIGAAFGLLDSAQNSKPVKPADVLGLIPNVWAQIGSELIDYEQNTPERYSKFAQAGKPKLQKPVLKETYKTVRDNLKGGGIITDEMGQWKYPGMVTRIPSNNITMEGVFEPLIGISNTGDTQYMEPNKNYKFKGKSVTEYPLNKWLDNYE